MTCELQSTESSLPLEFDTMQTRADRQRRDLKKRKGKRKKEKEKDKKECPARSLLLFRDPGSSSQTQLPSADPGSRPCGCLVLPCVVLHRFAIVNSKEHRLTVTALHTAGRSTRCWLSFEFSWSPHTTLAKHLKSESAVKEGSGPVATTGILCKGICMKSLLLNWIRKCKAGKPGKRGECTVD